MFKIFGSLILVALLAGCAAELGYRVDGPRIYSRYGYGYERYPGVVVKPCDPYNADTLMEWATGLGNSSHKRIASVEVYNYNVDCKSKEQASSSSQQKFQRPVKPDVSAASRPTTGEKR